MKINPWIVVSLLALVCGFLLGSRVENEAEAETPRYQYFFNPNGLEPYKDYGDKSDRAARYVRVNLNNGMFEELQALKATYAVNKDGTKRELEPYYIYHWVSIVSPSYYSLDVVHPTKAPGD